jgi:SAM-dependent methyltransferase
VTDSTLNLTENEDAAQKLYGGLWELFTDEEYERFAKWMWFDYYKLSEPVGRFMKDAAVLDAGCGGGALVYTSLLEGASRVVGVDLSEQALGHTRRLVERFAPDRAERMELRHASVLELPYEDATFDVVYSAGVLHHTEDPEGGFRELIRILKPGGIVWIGLYGAGGLLSGFLIPGARAFRKIIPETTTRKVLDLLRFPPLRRYEVLDAMYTPYRYQYREPEVHAWLQRAGLVEPLRTDPALHPLVKRTPWINGEGWIGMRAKKPDV